MESASIPAPGAAPGNKYVSPPKPEVVKKPKLRGTLEEAGDLAIFAVDALKSLPGSLRYFSEAIRLNAIITRRTTILLFLMCCFLGVSVSNFGFYFLRSIGAADFVGILPGLVTPRQTGPQMFAYVFAGSVCCGITADLASARIQDEVAALEAQGVEPMEILVGTRIIATLMFVPIATAICMLGNIAGSYFNVVLIVKGNSSGQFLGTLFSIFPLSGIIWCGLTVFLVTLQCAIVAAFYGMRRYEGGPAAVGTAVSRSLAVNIVLLHFVISLTALAIYGGSLGVPIGD